MIKEKFIIYNEDVYNPDTCWITLNKIINYKVSTSNAVEFTNIISDYAEEHGQYILFGGLLTSQLIQSQSVDVLDRIDHNAVYIITTK